MPSSPPPDWLRTILKLPGVRATGLWRVEGDRLMQVAFLPADDMPAEVADGFAGATQAVALDRLDLSIVRAHRTGRFAVARAEEVDSTAGSPYWLRRFGAARSIAVSIGDHVFSVATSDRLESDETWVDRLRGIHRSHEAQGGSA